MRAVILLVDTSTFQTHNTYVNSRVGDRGQITITKAIREELGIHAGDETVQRVEDGRIVIEVVPGRHHRSLAGSLRAKAGRHPADETWPALRDAAWETADPDRLA
jgi:AbrB family looped-hinge helix DNA binding protein